jgi:hypothetical protein
MKTLKIFFLFTLLSLSIHGEEYETHILLFSGSSIGDKQSKIMNIPMKILAKNLKSQGFTSIEHVPYKNNLYTSREEMVNSAIENLHKIFTKTTFTYDIIAHSMGHYIALAAILKSGYAGRIRKVIGLAGMAKGAEKAPRVCTKKGKDPQATCPGISSMIRGLSNFDVDQMYKNFEKQMQDIQLCSLVPRKDPRVTDPYKTSFFESGINYVVDRSLHFNLPSLRKTVPLLRSVCNL